MLKKTVILAAVATAALMNGTALAAAKYEMSFQSCYAPAQTQNPEILVPWAADFAKKTNGDLVMHFFPQGAVVEVNQTAHALRDGMLDGGIWGPASFPREAPYGYMVNLPFLTKSSRHGTDVAYALYDQFPEFRKDMDSVGELMCMWTSASFALSSVSAPIRSPDDLRGKRVLIVSASDAETITAWGGVPVFVGASDVYVGLQRGMGEAFYTAIPFQKGLRIMEVAKYITPLPSSANLMVLSINHDLFNQLPESFQRLLKEDSGRKLAGAISTSLDADVALALKLFQEAGAQVIELSPEEQAAFQTGLQSTIDDYWVKNLRDVGVKGDTREWIDKYYEISKSVAAQ